MDEKTPTEDPRLRCIGILVVLAWLIACVLVRNL
jgi:hypothetical protein